MITGQLYINGSVRQSEPHKEINVLEQLIDELKVCRKQPPKHITIADLPEKDRLRRLGTKSKYLIDTVQDDWLPGGNCHGKYHS